MLTEKKIERISYGALFIVAAGITAVIAVEGRDLKKIFADKEKMGQLKNALSHVKWRYAQHEPPEPSTH